MGDFVGHAQTQKDLRPVTRVTSKLLGSVLVFVHEKSSLGPLERMQGPKRNKGRAARRSLSDSKWLLAWAGRSAFLPHI